MNIQELRAQGAIYLNNIQDGFHQYHHEILALDESQAFTFFHDLCMKHNYLHAYADFYYYTLDAKAQAKIHLLLSDEELLYLRENSPALSNHANELIFPLTETLLQIICKLNATATLFSTLYFTETPRTYWGNYNQEYVVFF